MINLLNCSSIGLANIITILKRILDVIWIITPILAIIYLTINITKIMINPDEKKIPKKIQNQILAIFIVFMIPTIINATMYILGEKTDLSSCWKDATATATFKETSTYQEPLTNLPKNQIIEDRSVYEKGEKRTENNNNNQTATNNTSLDNLFSAAKKAANHTYTRGYHYDDAQSWDGIDMKDRHGKNAVSCDRGVGLTLYYAGLTTTDPNKLNLDTLSSELGSRGWKKITNYNSLQPGDIVFYDNDKDGDLDHTFLIGESIDKRYDWGSDKRIQYLYEYSGGMPFREGISSSSFEYAYRMP